MNRLNSEETGELELSMKSWSEVDLGEPGGRLEVTVALDETEAEAVFEALVAGEHETDQEAKEAVLRALGLL